MERQRRPPLLPMLNGPVCALQRVLRHRQIALQVKCDSWHFASSLFHAVLAPCGGACKRWLAHGSNFSFVDCRQWPSLFRRILRLSVGLRFLEPMPGSNQTYSVSSQPLIPTPLASVLRGDCSRFILQYFSVEFRQKRRIQTTRWSQRGRRR